MNDRRADATICADDSPEPPVRLDRRQEEPGGS
jgi:hypothetical protein